MRSISDACGPVLNERQTVDSLVETRYVLICRPAMRNLRRFLRVRFQADTIVDRIAEALFATEVSLGCLHRNVPQ